MASFWDAALGAVNLIVKRPSAGVTEVFVGSVKPTGGVPSVKTEVAVVTGVDVAMEFLVRTWAMYLRPLIKLPKVTS